MSALNITLRDLFEAGVHYGHKTKKWNPKMSPYVYGARNGIHIIDLQQTLPLLENAVEALKNCASKGGRILFVGTKIQATDYIQDVAESCGQYFINHRWLGGMLTNWKTVKQSINRMKNMEQTLENPTHLTKKEILKLQREYDKLQRSLGGISEMADLPHMIFVLDTNREKIAIEEAQKLGIPIVAILDSNSNPDNIDYPVPGNDDASRAISLYFDAFKKGILEGIEKSMEKAGIDMGEQADITEPKAHHRPKKDQKQRPQRNPKKGESHE